MSIRPIFPILIMPMFPILIMSMFPILITSGQCFRYLSHGVSSCIIDRGPL
ncbi:hypothetical protein L208DRAFT_504667 [Tricholoma matsutake]|nr:hypothetical protein L208DRAFT_504667 [Tricholoma matsutake 945]